MSQKKQLTQGNVVKEFFIGNTLIKICDDSCRNKTKADVQAILDRIARQAQVQLSVVQN
jgi:hypothetical protein